MEGKVGHWLATVDATTREHFEKRLHRAGKLAAAPRPERTVVRARRMPILPPPMRH